MKFSDTISNQSTLGFFSSTCAKWTVRNPTPKPRFGRSNRVRVERGDIVRIVASITGESGRTVPGRAGSDPPDSAAREADPFLVLDRNRAAAVALARVLARPAVVAGRAAAHALAAVRALAAVLLGGRA